MISFTNYIMVKIYCIEDCNGLKYVGSTTEKLNKRLSRHKRNKRANRPHCSCSKLQLENCKIYQLEETDEEHRFQKEQYWIDNIDCINKIRAFGFDYKARIASEKYKSYQKQRYEWRKSFGGDPRYNNNLLVIDLSIFN